MQNLRMRTKRYETEQGEGKNTKSFQTLGKQISMKNMTAKISDFYLLKVPRETSDDNVFKVQY